jgi:methanogenic corrinoid protein MtbC1
MMNYTTAILELLCQPVKSRDTRARAGLTKSALETDLDPIVVIEQGLAKGLRIDGEAFGTGEAYLTDLMFAAEAIKASASLVELVLLSKHKQREFKRAARIGTALQLVTPGN